MAMNTATQGNIQLVNDESWRYNQETPVRWEALQTQGSANTQGILGIFASATSQNDFRLMALHVDVIPASVTSVVDIMFDETTIGNVDIGASGLTAGSQHVSRVYPMTGLLGGTTTTLTTYVNCKVATSTIVFSAVGLRKL